MSEPIIHPLATWSASSIARFLDVSYSQAVQKIIPQDDFPRPLPLTENGQPRWIAGDVMAWRDARPRASLPAPRHRTGSKKANS